jgi:ATP-dependent DNA helicase DinG
MAVKEKKGGTVVQIELPVLVSDAAGPLVLQSDGAVVRQEPDGLVKTLQRSPVLVCNRPLLGRQLGIKIPQTLDILELTAFVLPAADLVPTASGLAKFLGIAEENRTGEAEARLLLKCLSALMKKVAQDDFWQKGNALAIAIDLELAEWPWAPYLAHPRYSSPPTASSWAELPSWREGPLPDPVHEARISPEEVQQRLSDALGPQAEPRPGQRAYAEAVAGIFGPAVHENAPILAILEAGTGIGKTLGYLAPGSLWAEKSGGTVWISTFTKNLQRQMDQELTAIYGGHDQKSHQTTIRKGRENYLCLLNLEEAIQGARTVGDKRRRILLGLVQRWLQFTRDGDMVGGDFPRWLAYLFPGPVLDNLNDRRGECIYAACGHYRQCFIERARRRTRNSRIVIANHAVTLIEATLRQNDPVLPRHFIFDEGHHLFAAADNAFSLHLTGREGLELRSWVLGAEGRRRGRTRGLKARLDDLVSADPEAARLLGATCRAAQALPANGWLRRLQMAQPSGACERFLMDVRAHVLASQKAAQKHHGLEAGANELPASLQAHALELAQVLKELAEPMRALATHLRQGLEGGKAKISDIDRVRVEAAVTAIKQRAQILSDGWIAILESAGGEITTAESHFDWLTLDRRDGRELDVGLHRHWLDPTEPLAEAVMAPASGICVTSATLRDRVRIAEGETDWTSAETRVGANHLPMAAIRRSFPSPFDYQAQSRVLIVTDLKKDDPDRIAAAYLDLFLASGGGAMGLFTAIERLRGVHQRITGQLSEQGLSLFAQHVDPLDPGTLIDIFKEEPQTCLLGTDALRDGIDVPGDALKLVVFDRVPWPRPTLLHRARRQRFGGRAYDEMLVRLRLRQAFGRLIRRATDRGVFALLDAGTPSRLLDGLPAGTPIERLRLEEAVAVTREFLASDRSDG